MDRDEVGKAQKRAIYDEDDDDEGYGDFGRRGKRPKNAASQFFDEEAAVDSDEEEDEEEGEDDFIDTGTSVLVDEGERVHCPPLHPSENAQNDVDELVRRIHERYTKAHADYDEEELEVEQQALLPSVRDPKLWMLKCMAIKVMRNILPSTLMLVPIKEMTDVLSVEIKSIDISRDYWVRMKAGAYKGDLAKVIDVDNVWRRARVKLIPRIDFCTHFL